MRLGRRAFLNSLAASVMAPAVLRLARADAPQVTLKLHHFFSSVSSGHEKFLVPWARQVTAQSAGRIRIDIFPSMQLGGAPAQLFDQGRDGFADIVWAVPGYSPGRFGRIEAFELPFVPSRRALVNSKALEDFAATNLGDEFSEVHPICFSCRDRSVVHTNRTVRAVSDLRGLRLHVPNRLAAESVHALGATGVTVPVPQVPMAVSGHAIEGCLMPWDAVPALRLNDLLKQHTDFADSALSTSTFVLAMNKSVYDHLPSDLKAVIDKNSGLEAAGMAGAMWDVEAKIVADMVRERGDPMTVLAEDEVANWRAATRSVVSLWLKQMKARKTDGGKLLANLHALIGKYASEPEPQTQPPREPHSSEPAEPHVTERHVAEPKVVSQPPKSTRSPQAPQTTAEVARPKADAPAAAPRPAAKRAPLKELDIPL
jgi:TRAP-type transport system periplasmic protein